MSPRRRRRGGTVTEEDRRTGAATTYEAVGMQALLDAVRGTGARNVVIAGGLDWSYDLAGILRGRRLADPDGHGVIYANHTYPFKGDTVGRWVAKLEAATREIPVIVSEFGSDPRGGAGLTGEQWVRQVLQALRDHDWDWTAWDFHPRASPCLISDWKYTPTPGFGVLVKEALAGKYPTQDPSSAPVGQRQARPDLPTENAQQTRRPGRGRSTRGLLEGHPMRPERVKRTGRQRSVRR